MRVENWKAPQVFNHIAEVALDEAGTIMDAVTADAKAKCPVLKNLDWERPDGWSKATVSFTPKTGPNKGRLVQFNTDKRWTGRKRGDLRDTIRKVTAEKRPGNIRVYAGNFKIYWAFMVERGTRRTAAQPFLRPAFNTIRQTIASRIQSKLRTV